MPHSLELRHYLLREHFQRLHRFLVREAAEIYLEDRVSQTEVVGGPAQPARATFRSTEYNTVALIQIFIGGATEQFRQSTLVFLVIGRLPGDLLIQFGEKSPILSEMFARQRMGFIVARRDV